MLGIDLERLFRAPGQIAVLRALWKSPAPLTGRQVQQLAGVHNLTAMKCLVGLEKLGLLQKRAAGRANLYSLKKTHRIVRDLVNPIFKAEQAAPERFLRELSKILSGHCLCAVIYGSVARKQSKTTGDIDLLVVVKDKSSAERFISGPQEKAELLVGKGWSLMLEVNVKTRAELIKQFNSRLIKQIRREGRLITGISLEDLRRGKNS